jgi:drug/metabolite transporter (DMT)-like permease
VGVTLTALGLILAAAVLHAAWNLCAKRAGGGLPFVWLVGALICAAYVPVLAVYLPWKSPEIPWAAAGWIFGSGVLKTVYSLVLQRSYRTGDFSLIYPLARGTGPLLSTVAAVVVLGERPTPLALAGAALIIGGVFWVAGGVRLLHQDRAHLRVALAYGSASGVCIAAYTLWDKHGVAGLAIAPILYDAGTAATQLALLTPFAVRRWPEVVHHWRRDLRWALGVALLSPVTYVLVLTAMRFTPVSYVAPAREVSIIFGAFVGAKMLKEGDVARRVSAAIVMAAGVIMLALG